MPCQYALHPYFGQSRLPQVPGSCESPRGRDGRGLPLAACFRARSRARRSAAACLRLAARARRCGLPLAAPLVGGGLPLPGLEVASLGAGVPQAARLVARPALPGDRVPQRGSAPAALAGRAQVSAEAARLPARPAPQGPAQLQPHGVGILRRRSLTAASRETAGQQARRGTPRGTGGDVPRLTAFPQVSACRASAAHVPRPHRPRRRG